MGWNRYGLDRYYAVERELKVKTRLLERLIPRVRVLDAEISELRSLFLKGKKKRVGLQKVPVPLPLPRPFSEFRSRGLRLSQSVRSPAILRRKQRSRG